MRIIKILINWPVLIFLLIFGVPVAILLWIFDGRAVEDITNSEALSGDSWFWE